MHRVIQNNWDQKMTTVLPIEKVAATVIGKHLQLQAPMPKQES